MTLVELCAGSAAVSLRWLSSTARPPIAYQGGKRGYADAILTALGLQPGGGRGHQVVLVEPGPWGEAWSLWRTPTGRTGTVEQLRAWTGEDPRALWRRLAGAPVPDALAERVATWAVLQFWSFGRKPVLPAGAAWRTHGFNAAEAYRDEYRPEDGYAARPRRLPDVIEALEALPDLSHVQVLTCDAVEVPPLPGALALIDPPYQGTTCAYSHDLPRADVLGLAERWAAAGATVAVCEAEALPIVGWHHLQLPPPVGIRPHLVEAAHRVPDALPPAGGPARPAWRCGMTRRWIPLAALPAHLAEGWRLVWDEPGGSHPIVRPAGALVERARGAA